jgi:putative phosphoesterase
MMTPDEASSGSFLLIRKPQQSAWPTVPAGRLGEDFVKVVIVSDIHSNLAALEAFPEKDFDQLWCIGDLVDYGPRPGEVIQWVREKATLAVRGNHDHAVGFGVSPQCSAPFIRLAAETQRFTQEICTEADTAYLRGLPFQQTVAVDATSFYVVHAIPTNPLFGYCPEESDQWQREIEWIRANVLVVGHTHTPFIRKVGGTTIVNPGSIGQPKTGRSLACYASWEDGQLTLKEYAYPLAETVREIREMPVPQDIRDGLVKVLETGDLPPKSIWRNAKQLATD